MTTYHIIGGGQKIRQNQDCGNHEVKIIERETNYVEKSGVYGSDSYTNEMWNTDLDRLIRNALEWAYYPDLITFNVTR